VLVKRPGLSEIWCNWSPDTPGRFSERHGSDSRCHRDAEPSTNYQLTRPEDAAKAGT
jgi:hypothetical protein